MPLDQVDVGADYYKGDDSGKALPPVEKEMSFLDHLEELRWHIIRSLGAIVLTGIVIFLYKDFVFGTVIFGPRNKDFLSYQAIFWLVEAIGVSKESLGNIPVELKLQAIGLGEKFLIHIKSSFTLGFIAAFPYIFYEVWQFVSPGLYEKERNTIRGIVVICSFLFFTGVLFGYFVIAPFAVNFLAGYELGGAESAITLDSYVGYMIMFTAPTGLIFQLPVVVYFLAKLGLITADVMKAYRRHAIIVILLLAAIITPPDVMTQFLIGIPLFMLYEVSINIAKRVEKQEAAEE